MSILDQNIINDTNNQIEIYLTLINDTAECIYKDVRRRSRGILKRKSRIKVIDYLITFKSPRFEFAKHEIFTSELSKESIADKLKNAFFMKKWNPMPKAEDVKILYEFSSNYTVIW